MGLLSKLFPIAHTQFEFLANCAPALEWHFHDECIKDAAIPNSTSRRAEILSTSQDLGTQLQEARKTHPLFEIEKRKHT